MRFAGQCEAWWGWLWRRPLSAGRPQGSESGGAAGLKRVRERQRALVDARLSMQPMQHQQQQHWGEGVPPQRSSSLMSGVGNGAPPSSPRMHAYSGVQHFPIPHSPPHRKADNASRRTGEQARGGGYSGGAQQVSLSLARSLARSLSLPPSPSLFPSLSRCLLFPPPSLPLSLSLTAGGGGAADASSAQPDGRAAVRHLASQPEPAGASHIPLSHSVFHINTEKCCAVPPPPPLPLSPFSLFFTAVRGVARRPCRRHGAKVPTSPPPSPSRLLIQI